MTQVEFLQALKDEGFGLPEFFGYCDLGIPGRKISASYMNVPKSRGLWAARLDYLREARAKHEIAV